MLLGYMGDSGGGYVLRLVCKIRKPIVSTLHTIRRDAEPDRIEIIRALAHHSTRVITFNSCSAVRLASQFDVNIDKVEIVPHGVPDTPFVTPERGAIRARLGAARVMISAGHFRREKGYETGLEALARLKLVCPDFKYVLLGAQQPQFPPDRQYERDLAGLIKSLGLDEQVVRIDEYLSRDRLIAYVNASDVGLLTYNNPCQNSSGMLSLFLGCGRPVVTTCFEAAETIMAQVPGLRVASSNSPRSICHSLQQVTSSELKKLMRATYAATRVWAWPNCAARYHEIFVSVL